MHLVPGHKLQIQNGLSAPRPERTTDALPSHLTGPGERAGVDSPLQEEEPRATHLSGEIGNTTVNMASRGRRETRRDR